MEPTQSKIWAKLFPSNGHIYPEKQPYKHSFDNSC